MATTRVHYVSDCENTQDNDTLAVSYAEAIETVNCTECLDEMSACGVFAESEDNYIGDEYYSGTGELIGDDSYIDYLNNY